MALALEPQRSCQRPETKPLVIGRATDGKAVPVLSVRLVACAAAALGLFLLQVGALITLDIEPVVRVLLPATMAGLLPLAWVGRELVGVRVMAAGLLLNLAAIVANGGLMPIAPETVQAVAGAEELAKYEPGRRLPGSKDVLLAKDDTRLQPFSDQIILPLEGRLRHAVSPGDLIVAAGVALTVAQVLGQRARTWIGGSALLKEKPT